MKPLSVLANVSLALILTGGCSKGVATPRAASTSQTEHNSILKDVPYACLWGCVRVIGESVECPDGTSYTKWWLEFKFDPACGATIEQWPTWYTADQNVYMYFEDPNLNPSALGYHLTWNAGLYYLRIDQLTNDPCEERGHFIQDPYWDFLATMFLDFNPDTGVYSMKDCESSVWSLHFSFPGPHSLSSVTRSAQTRCCSNDEW